MISETRRLAMRRAHSGRAYFCSCGKIVYGNGGRSSHRAMHKRQLDGHGYVIEDKWRLMFPKGVPHED